MNVQLSGKVALVTGAGRGIGRVTANILAENGAAVVYTDVDGAAAIEAAHGVPGASAFSLDVTDEAQINEVIDRVVAQHGSLDILINNAGTNTLHHRVTIDQFPRSEWDRLLAVDLTGVYSMSHAATRAMLRQKTGGRIINIASVVGLVPLRLQCAFAAAKAGVVNLTKAMAIELGGRGVLVNCVAPGSILTEGTRQLFYGENGKFKDSVSQLLAHVPLGRPGSPEEVANCILFLAAPESSYVNGAVLTVDGGWTAGYTREF
ncbi:MAG: SDR family oxidoreductase [Chthoniobacterales bacterium]|nr:SDR family oxidoreductase [Chthoniobacterales bacterium]